MAVVYGIRSDNKCKRRVVAYNELLELSATDYMDPTGTNGTNIGLIHNFWLPSDFSDDFYIIALECHSMDDDTIKKWGTCANKDVTFRATREVDSKGDVYISVQIHDPSSLYFYSGEQVEIRVLLMPKGE